MNKGEIRAHFKALLNRSDITDALADTFIDQSISRIQRALRIPSMEKSHTYNISGSTGSVLLPNDFLEAIDLSSDSHTLERLPMPEMRNFKKTGEAGVPHFFTREGGSLLIHPTPSSGSLSPSPEQVPRSRSSRNLAEQHSGAETNTCVLGRFVS